MLLAQDVFHHVYDFTFVELPFGVELPLPSLFGVQLTKFMLLQLIAAVIVVVIFRGLAKRIRSGSTANGWWWNFWEMLAVYVRDEVVRPIIGDPDAHHDNHGVGDHGHVYGDDVPREGHPHSVEEAIHVAHDGDVDGVHPADRYAPFVWSCFFYILICNLLGALPWMGSATGNINVTGALAFSAFAATFVYGAQKMGFVGFWKNLVPGIEAPGPIKILLIPMMFLIEVLGLFIKHGVLAVRLFANIMGGHTVLGVILGFIAMTASHGAWWVVAPASIFGQIGVGLLELLVAFIQAYVFAFLATIFIGMSLHAH